MSFTPFTNSIASLAVGVNSVTLYTVPAGKVMNLSRLTADVGPNAVGATAITLQYLNLQINGVTINLRGGSFTSSASGLNIPSFNLANIPVGSGVLITATCNVVAVTGNWYLFGSGEGMLE